VASKQLVPLELTLVVLGTWSKMLVITTGEVMRDWRQNGAVRPSHSHALLLIRLTVDNQRRVLGAPLPNTNEFRVLRFSAPSIVAVASSDIEVRQARADIPSAGRSGRRSDRPTRFLTADWYGLINCGETSPRGIALKPPLISTKRRLFHAHGSRWQPIFA
jgi:hypothetical protein